MKNILEINVDTDRKPSLTFSHPSDFTPTNSDEAKIVITNDIACVFEGFRVLVELADKNGYGKKEDFINTAIAELNKMLLIK